MKNNCRFSCISANYFVPLTSSKVLTFEKTQNSFGFLLTFSYLCSSLQQFAAVCSSFITSLEMPLRKGLIINRGNLKRIERAFKVFRTPVQTILSARSNCFERTLLPRRGGTSFPAIRHFSPRETAPSPLPSGTSLRDIQTFPVSLDTFSLH